MKKITMLMLCLLPSSFYSVLAQGTERVVVSGQRLEPVPTYDPYALQSELDSLAQDAFLADSFGDTFRDESIPTEKTDEEKKEKECEDKTRTADTEHSECKLDVHDAASQVLTMACKGQNQIGVDFSITVTNKIISGLIGANITSDNYTKCKDQLDLNVNRGLAVCDVTLKRAVEDACNG